MVQVTAMHEIWVRKKERKRETQREIERKREREREEKKKGIMDHTLRKRGKESKGRLRQNMIS